MLCIEKQVFVAAYAEEIIVLTTVSKCTEEMNVDTTIFDIFGINQNNSLLKAKDQTTISYLHENRERTTYMKIQ